MALIAAITICLAACDAAEDREAAENRQRLAASDSAKQQLEAQVKSLRGQLDELQQRGNVIYTVALSVLASGVSGAPATDGKAANFLTSGVLDAQDGTAYRFIGRNPLGDAPQGGLALRYEPVNPTDFMTRQIDLLSGISTIQLDFPASVKAAGMTWTDAASLHLEVSVNGLPVVAIDRRPDLEALRAGSPVRWEVGDEFRRIPHQYTEQLSQRRQR